jgi:hypothetical protein
MGDLVLKTRVAVARRNLQRVIELSSTIERRLAGLGEFLSLPKTVRYALNDAWKKSHALESLAQEVQDEKPELLEGLQALSGQLNKIRNDLKEKCDQAEQLRSDLTQPFSERQDVKDFLLKSAEQLVPNLTVDKYFQNQKRIDALFSEYVDLLRGVALRSAGFGDDDAQLSDLFLIADQLPGLWGRVDGWSWQSLAVPSRQDGSGSSEAMVLRVGFPEWTIWALPFVQHGFGHVFAKKRQFAPPGSTDAINAEALADALATVATGPAYACAALLLRLDPAEVKRPTEEKGPTEATARSATILVTLRRIAAADSDGPVAILTDRLCSEWREAVAAAGGDVDAFDSAMAAPLSADLADWARRELLGPASGDPAQPLWLRRWGTIATWAGHLQKGQHEKIDLADLAIKRDDRRMALVFMLDAAWLARVGTQASEDSEDSEDAENVIAKGAIAKMLEVVRPQARQPAGAGDPGPNLRPTQ